MTDLREVVAFIGTIEDEDELRLIFTASNDRTKTLRRTRALQMAATIKVGDAVTLMGLSPKYLNGVKGTVTAHKDGGKFAVDIGFGAGRFHGIVRVPASSLRLVAE